MTTIEMPTDGAVAREMAILQAQVDHWRNEQTAWQVTLENILHKVEDEGSVNVYSPTTKKTVRLHSDESIVAVAETIREGLKVEGAHHKQWYLERALEKLFGHICNTLESEQGEWEPGVAP